MGVILEFGYITLDGREIYLDINMIYTQRSHNVQIKMSVFGRERPCVWPGGDCFQGEDPE